MSTSRETQPTVQVKGTAVPQLGFGTWQITGRDCEDGVRDALDIGYRHIDTARAYENESEVGAGLAAGGVAREQIFLTPPDDAAPEHLVSVLEKSLRKLRTEYVDLLLLHWPNPDVPVEQTLDAMVDLRDRGLIRQLGVSNFPAGLLTTALEHAPVFCNQVEYHPFLDQSRLLELARPNDVLITAYSPLAHGRVLDDPTLTEIGEAHGKSAGQVALRWLLDQPLVCAIPKASSHERRLENWQVFDFELTDEDREQIDALPKNRREVDPSFAPDWDA